MTGTMWTAPGGATADGANAGACLRAAVIEDDERIAELWTEVLEADGYAVLHRDSGLGLAGVLRDWRPDVVLLDLGLPYRSGAAVLADLKADPQTAPIPVVIVSGAIEALSPARAALAAAVLSKPVSLQRLRDAVATAVSAGTA